MRRTFLTSDEIMGGMCTWPFALSVSHNVRRKRWTAYVRFLDPEYPSTETFVLASPWDVNDLTERIGQTVEWLVEVLDEAKDPEFASLREWVAGMVGERWEVGVVRDPD